MANTSLSAFVAAIAPKSRGVVDERREEVDREDERPLVVEPVDGGVVRGARPDEQVLASAGTSPASSSSSRAAGYLAAQPPHEVSRSA